MERRKAREKVFLPFSFSSPPAPAARVTRRRVGTSQMYSINVRMQYYSKHEFQRKYHFMNTIFLQDRKKNFEKQQSKMKKRNSSFLDSIRMEVENEEEF